MAATFNTFAEQLRAAKMPSKATAANAALVASVSRAGAIFARLGAATSATQYISAAKASSLPEALNQVNQAYANLGTALRLVTTRDAEPFIGTPDDPHTSTLLRGVCGRLTWHMVQVRHIRLIRLPPLCRWAPCR